MADNIIDFLLDVTGIHDHIIKPFDNAVGPQLKKLGITPPQELQEQRRQRDLRIVEANNRKPTVSEKLINANTTNQELQDRVDQLEREKSDLEDEVQRLSWR